MHRQDQRKTLARPHEATPVNSGGAQREGAPAGPCTLSSDGPTITTWQSRRLRTLLLYDRLFRERENDPFLDPFHHLAQARVASRGLCAA